MRLPTAVAALAAVLILSACAPNNRGTTGGRRDPTFDASADRGSRTPQGQDLTAATDRMAEDIASRLDVVNSESPPRIVVGRIENNTSLRNNDYQVFLVRLRSILNQSGSRHGMEFVRERDFIEAQREREYGDKDPGSTAERYASRADYVLTCEIFDLPSVGTDYFLFDYQLVQLREAATGPDVGPGAIVWENMYEVKYK